MILILVAIFIFLYNSRNIAFLENQDLGGQATIFNVLQENFKIIESAQVLKKAAASSSSSSEANTVTGVLAALNISEDTAENDDANLIDHNAFIAPLYIYTTQTSKNQRTEIIKYTVAEGDTLSAISAKFGITLQTLLWANSLKDQDYLSIGQELKVPPVSGVVHIVKKSDTVSSIASKYKASEDKIIAFNGLPKDGNLIEGKTVVVPDGVIPAPARPKVFYGRTGGRRFASLPSLDGFFTAPATGFNWGRIHGNNGIDISNACQTPIYAAAAGLVAISDAVGWNGGFGRFVKINHPNGTNTVYAHNYQILVEAGQEVEQGQMIALMGSSGRSTGCHLHFEVHGARNPLGRY